MLDIASIAPPPMNTGCPVSPSKPCSRPSPPAPRPHTIMSECPSGVVTMGDPPPFCLAHQATEICGGDVALILRAVRSPAFPPGHPIPPPLKTTYVARAVVYAAGALMI